MFSVSSCILSAQNDSIRHTVSVNAGASLAGVVIRFFDVNDSILTASYPVAQLNYDFGVKKWFSLGLATSYQQFNLTYTDYHFFDESYGLISQNISAKLSRINIAARALFHYGNSGNVDMYSGVRLGYTQWKLTTDYSEVFKPEDFKLGLFAPQLVLFGFRGYFTEHIGAGAEFCIGSPHYLSAGLNYRF